MNPYNFSMMIFTGGTFFLALLVLLKRQDNIGKSYFIFNIFVAIWGIFHSIEISQNVSYDTALLCSRLGQASAVFIMPTWLHLTLIINEKERKYRNWLILTYLVSFVIVSFSFSRWFLPYVAPTNEFNFYHRRGPVYDLFTVLFFIVVPIGYLNLIQKIKRSTRQQATQLLGFTLATGIGFIGGAFCFLPIYDILFPQYNLLIMPIYPLLFSYFMIRHKLFDVEQIIEAFQREKLASLGLLAASVNHEIRNPLFAARSNLDNLLEGNFKDVKETAEKVRSQIEKTLDVISKLNRFVRPTTKVTNEELTASIQEAIQNVLELISFQFKLDKVNVQNNISKEIPLIKCDQRQLEEILFNLIVNACHAMEKGGELTITASCDCHPEERSDEGSRFFASLRMTGKIQIVIQDTGHGISSEQMKHLFEPFHTTKGEKGTGLGLYITKQLVERNGGKISVSSKPGRGTSFILEFKQ